MLVRLFKEIIALSLCQGVAITVLLIIIHESFVYVHPRTDLSIKMISTFLNLNIKLSVTKTLSIPNCSRTK